MTESVCIQVSTKYSFQHLTYWPEPQHKDVFNHIEIVDKNNLEAQNPKRDTSIPSVSTGLDCVGLCRTALPPGNIPPTLSLVYQVNINGFAIALDCTLKVVHFSFCSVQVMPLFKLL